MAGILEGLTPAVALLLSGILEGFGVPWPSPFILAGYGVGLDHGRALLLLSCTFALGYLTGATAQYLLGRFLGSLALRWIPADKQARLDEVFRRYGEPSVLWSRPLPVGNFVSAPAGIMGMPLWKFLLYTWLGIWPWALLMLTAGQSLGSLLGPLDETVDHWVVPGLLVLGVLGLGAYLWRLRKRKRSGAARGPQKLS